MKTCRAIAPHATIVATADDARHAELLRGEGADVVVNANQLFADAVVPELAKLLSPQASPIAAPAAVAAH